MLVRAFVVSVGFSLVAWPCAAQPPSDPQTPATQQPATPQPDELTQPTRGTAPTEITPASRPERPYRGIFGVPQGNLEPRLIFEGMGGGGMGSNPARAQTTPGAGAGSGAGGGGTGAATASATVTYLYTRQRAGINASNVFFSDFYTQSPVSYLSRDVFSAGVYYMLTPATRVTVSPTWKNLPEFSLSDLLGTELGQVVPQPQDVGLTVDRYTRFGTSIDLSHQFSNRAKFISTLDYGHGKIVPREWTILMLSGTFSYNLTRGLAAYGGYQYGGQHFKTTNSTVAPDGSTASAGTSAADGTTAPTTPSSTIQQTRPRVDFGIDFNRPLSLTRRTTLVFSTGVAGIHDQTDNTTNYYLVGGARLNREFGRSWNAGVFYGRNVRYLEAYPNPLLSYSGGAVLNGMVNHRTDVTASFGVSDGNAGSAASFTTYFGSTQMTIALSRMFAVGVDYWYSHLVADPHSLPITLAGKLDEQTAHVYIKVWTSLISRPKRM